MADCTPQGLASAAQCFDSCVPPGMQQALQTYLLAQIANSVAGTSTDPEVLAQQASCFFCNYGMDAPIQTFLLCKIVTALGG
jgi:hypothetical protein